jgi:transcriptional regulator with XRE-family HTH domain
VAILPIIFTCSKPTKIPQILKSWGDHIKKRRLELGLFQSTVAQAIGVTTSTVTNWEKNRTQPTLQTLPKIQKFLGYTPNIVLPTTFGAKIISYRKQHGLSQRAFANLLQIDPTTLSRWEQNKSQPQNYLKERLHIYIKSLHTDNEGLKQ